VEGLAFVDFDETDVVRHHLVQRIIHAYDEHKTRIAEQQMLLLSEARPVVESRSAEVSGGETVSSGNEKAISAEAKG
jgi:phosphate starvation-inducible PhoH-like protein